MPQLLEPSSLAEALEMLGKQPDAHPLAGGVAILQRARLGGALSTTYVGLGRLNELRGIHSLGGMLTVGAMTSLAQIAASSAVNEAAPLLGMAAGRAASAGVRSIATLGGNLVDTVATSDLAASLLALNATLELADSGGGRRLPLDRAANQTGPWLPPASLLRAVSIPASSADGWGFERLPLRGAADSSVATIAVRMAIAAGRVSDARAWATAVAERPVRLGALESSLGQRPLAELNEGPDDVRSAVESDVAGQELSTDERASAWYRAEVIVELTMRAVRAAAGRGVP